MKIEIAQINTVVGDIKANTSKIIQCIENAKKNNSDILVFPEMTLPSYPLNDLIYEIDFLRQQESAITKIKSYTNNIAVIIGYVDFDETQQYHDDTCLKHNAAIVIQNKKIIAKRFKSLLPNYDVFHEQRYFKPNKVVEPVNLEIHGKKRIIGLQICEDLWDEFYEIKVSKELVKQGAEVLINISASPFEIDKYGERFELVSKKAAEFNIPFVYCNLIGGQDDLVFDGNSFICDQQGKCILKLSSFNEDQKHIDISQNQSEIPSFNETEESLLYQALILGLRDYFVKNNLKQAIIGLSGGIDSALVAVLLAHAIGSENVTALSLPSKYSSDHSKDDAKQLAENIQIKYQTISIESFHQLFESNYSIWFENEEVHLADENLQARLRGIILMLYANQQNKILVSTGNKSEIALGYSTLYGDMNGAISVIGDLTKTRVRNLCDFINQQSNSEIIPQNIISKPPSAELRDGQVDPFDYDHISPIIEEIIENRQSIQELLDKGYDKSLLDDIFNRIYSNEFKRFQSNIILKVTSKSFGFGRIYPITNHYRG